MYTVRNNISNAYEAKAGDMNWIDIVILIVQFNII